MRTEPLTVSTSRTCAALPTLIEPFTVETSPACWPASTSMLPFTLLMFPVAPRATAEKA